MTYSPIMWHRLSYQMDPKNGSLQQEEVPRTILDCDTKDMANLFDFQQLGSSIRYQLDC